MAVERKEWEDRYDEIKNMPDVPTNEQNKEEWEGMELDFKARLAKIKDSTSPEYKAIMAERKQAKKEFESEQKSYYSVQTYLKENGTNLEAVKKNFRYIDKTRENRDVYQSLLDELLAAKEANSKIEARREQIQEEIKKLDEELKELKQQEKDALNAIKNFAKTPEQKEAAQSWLEEVRGKIKINQNEYPEKQKELKAELEKPLIEVPENDIKELQEKIDRCNKTCELLLQGKNMGEVYAELGTVSQASEKVEQNRVKQNKVEQNQVEQNQVEQNQVKQNQVEQNQVKQNQVEQNRVEQNKVEQEQENREEAPLSRIAIEIGRNVHSTTYREDGTQKETEDIDLSSGSSEDLEEKFQQEFDNSISLSDEEWNEIEAWQDEYPKYDPVVIEELARAVSSPEEFLEQAEAYLKIMNGEDIEENREIFKVDLKYDLTKMKGVDKEIKREIRRNAKEAKKLGIAEVETHFTKVTKWFKEKFDGIVPVARKLLPKGREAEESVVEEEEYIVEEEGPIIEEAKVLDSFEEFRKSLSEARYMSDTDQRIAYAEAKNKDIFHQQFPTDKKPAWQMVEENSETEQEEEETR